MKYISQWHDQSQWSIAQITPSKLTANAKWWPFWSRASNSFVHVYENRRSFGLMPNCVIFSAHCLKLDCFINQGVELMFRRHSSISSIILREFSYKESCLFSLSFNAAFKTWYASSGQFNWEYSTTFEDHSFSNWM